MQDETNPDQIAGKCTYCDALFTESEMDELDNRCPRCKVRGCLMDIPRKEITNEKE